MNSIKYFMLSLTFIIACTTSQVYGQEEEATGQSLRHNTELRTFYSEVDYRIAKGFVSAHAEQVQSKTAGALQGINMHPAVSAAIENAQFQSQYKKGGKFNGVRVSYGVKGGKKVAVILPLDEAGRVATPANNDKMYVVDMVTGFSDPCPPNCF